jgi:hypothetical protein
MTQKNTIDPAGWGEFLQDFSQRNRGRRARFDIFEQSGRTAEELQEGVFESVSLEDRHVTVERSYDDRGEAKTMTDEIKDVHGIAVQLDTDGSESAIEFSNHNGDMTQLHFESKVDGDS